MLNQFAVLQATLRAWLTTRANFSETGASMVEYALLLALIAVAAIIALVTLGGSVHNTLNNVNTGINNAGAAG
jgi:pilus assembly protein Flp/PilA